MHICTPVDRVRMCTRVENWARLFQRVPGSLNAKTANLVMSRVHVVKNRACLAVPIVQTAKECLKNELHSQGLHNTQEELKFSRYISYNCNVIDNPRPSKYLVYHRQRLIAGLELVHSRSYQIG